MTNVATKTPRSCCCTPQCGFGPIEYTRFKFKPRGSKRQRRVWAYLMR